MRNSIFQEKLQTSGSRSPSSGPRDSQRPELQVILRAFPVLLAVILLAHPFTAVFAGFPYKRVVALKMPVKLKTAIHRCNKGSSHRPTVPTSTPIRRTATR